MPSLFEKVIERRCPKSWKSLRAEPSLKYVVVCSTNSLLRYKLGIIQQNSLLFFVSKCQLCMNNEICNWSRSCNVVVANSLPSERVMAAFCSLVSFLFTSKPVVCCKQNFPAEVFASQIIQLSEFGWFFSTSLVGSHCFGPLYRLYTDLMPA